MIKLFGARARVFIRYEAGIKELATVIAKGLMLPDLEVDFSESEPYELAAMDQVLGFQIWLNGISEDGKKVASGYDFELEISTGLSHEEIMNDRMYDLSLWLGRYVSVICHIDTCVLGAEGDPVYFRRDDGALN